ncbi:hypothetical protein ACIPYQ_39575 [Streptomyces sp. NPDC090045]|uniref:hypothetical protein n=1 Tax=Streptomyces sp. NPDC090045 TaxID=3365927 RepID=UPI0037FA72F6
MRSNETLVWQPASGSWRSGSPRCSVEVWTLLEEDQERLRGTSGAADRLGFALLLEFFGFR